MRVAVIDMGTNTFHLIIVETEGVDFQVIYREKAAVKIGENGINQGEIIPEAIDRALKTLKSFKEIIDKYFVEEVYATATSAIRNASNGKELVKVIELETGIKTNIISGLDEARYIYFGVKKALNIGNIPQLIMDIGGGSIEFIIATNKEALWMHSFEIGGLRLLEKFQKNDPISKTEVSTLENYLEEELELLFEVCKKFQPRTLIGSSGTFDTLSDIYRLKEGLKKVDQTEYPLPIDAFNIIFKEILVKNKQERMQIPGMIALRVEMIVVATVLINFIITRLNIKQMRVSAYALKEGVLLSTLDSLKKSQLS